MRIVDESLGRTAGGKRVDPGLSQRVQSLRLPTDSGQARGRGSWLIVLLALLVLAVVGGVLAWPSLKTLPWIAGWLAETTAASTEVKAADAANGNSRATATQTGSVASANFSAGPASDIVLESKGYIIPSRQILISPKVSGMIQKLNVLEGMRVTKGDILAQLEDIDYQADLRRAEGGLKAAQERLGELERGFRPEEISQAEAELAEAQAQLTQFEADFKRATELRAKNVISSEEFDTAQSRYRAMQRRSERLTFALSLMRQGPRQERIDVARAEVKQAEAEVAKAQWRLGNTVIRAPVSGTILKKNAEEGNIVNPIAFNGSFSICEMADLADLEVELTIQERDISKIRKDQKCKIRAEAFPERAYDGRVSRLMPIADRAKGAIPVRVKISIPADEEGVYLKPEMGAIVTFFRDQSPRTDPPGQ